MVHLLPDCAFSETTSKARYGPAYVRAVCSQAGLGFTETAVDEDTCAVDGMIHVKPAPVYVQIKCSDQFQIAGGLTATWTAKQHWRESWRSEALPVYFILVLVERTERPKWLDHQDRGTYHRSAAFWAMVNHVRDDENITVEKDKRFTVETLRDWEIAVRALFTPLSGS